MSRTPIILAVLALLGGCTVYGHGDYGYRHSHYYSGYRDRHYEVYPIRYYRYERHDYRHYAPPPRYDGGKHVPQHRGKGAYPPRYHGAGPAHKYKGQQQTPQKISRRTYHQAKSNEGPRHWRRD
ncbi:hypothetical protein NAV26_05330 [Pseudomonas stutzeri]|uniref:hypothetical protein n=1 Tax=Stutzerimonas stutzeri TaxID=316 RepID=UPI0011AEC96B|nr:hypothetical protein [Stutzerimonas stutzeri]MCQ4324385.1 hypothetical protein [Stutzerimonas stutzeri]